MPVVFPILKKCLVRYNRTVNVVVFSSVPDRLMHRESGKSEIDLKTNGYLLKIVIFSSCIFYSETYLISERMLLVKLQFNIK